MKRGFTFAVLIVAMSSPAWAKSKADLPPWIGEWTAGPEQFITIKSEGDALLIEGSATYGAEDPEKAAIGAINVGDFSVLVPADWIEEGKVSFGVGQDGPLRFDDADEFDCVVNIALSGQSLEVADNYMCGGMNVTFDGTYSRK